MTEVFAGEAVNTQPLCPMRLNEQRKNKNLTILKYHNIYARQNRSHQHHVNTRRIPMIFLFQLLNSH
jgi:hypothetical protein